jgi:membrane protein
MLARLKFLYRIGINTINKWVADDIPMHGAALAFYTIFSIAPVLIIIVSIVGWLWGDYTALYELRRLVSDYLDPQMASTVDEILQQAVSQDGVAMPIISGFVLVFAATTAVSQLKYTLNTIWAVKTRDGKGVLQFVVDRLLSLLLIFSLTLLLVLSVIFDTILYAIAPHIEAITDLPLGVADIFNTSLLWLTTFLLFVVIFKVLPDLHLRWRDVSLGAMVTTVLFMGGKFLIGLYLKNFGSYDVFGAAGTFVVLLIWVYYNAQVVYLGAESIQVYMTMKNRPLLPKRFAYFEEKS